MTIYQRLDRYHGLTQQRRKRYTVVYTTSGTYLSAAVIPNPDDTPNCRRYIVESVLYSCDSDGPEEAHFLAAFLNSAYVDLELKPLQAIGAFGPRHFHKKVWSLPIPAYTQGKREHRELALLGADCSQRVDTFMKTVPAQQREGSLLNLAK